jgi:hypothetical protein
LEYHHKDALPCLVLNILSCLIITLPHCSHPTTGWHGVEVSGADCPGNKAWYVFGKPHFAALSRLTGNKSPATEQGSEREPLALLVVPIAQFEAIIGE